MKTPTNLKKTKRKFSFKPLIPNLGITQLHNEFKKINSIIRTGRNSIFTIEKVIYSNELFTKVVNKGIVIDGETLYKDLKQFIAYNAKDQKTSTATMLLFDGMLSKLKNRTVTIDDNFVNGIKEIVWVTYYVGEKDIPLQYLTNQCKLLNYITNDGIGFKPEHYNFDSIKEKIIVNICSLRNSKVSLLPYPEVCSLDDLEELYIKNLPDDLYIINLIKEIRKKIFFERIRYIGLVISIFKEKCNVK